MQRLEEVLDGFVMDLHVTTFTVVPSSDDLCRKCGEVMVAAQRVGRRIGCADAWIAATALLYEGADTPTLLALAREPSDDLVEQLRIRGSDPAHPTQFTLIVPESPIGDEPGVTSARLAQALETLEKAAKAVAAARLAEATAFQPANRMHSHGACAN